MKKKPEQVYVVCPNCWGVHTVGFLDYKDSETHWDVIAYVLRGGTTVPVDAYLVIDWEDEDLIPVAISYNDDEKIPIEKQVQVRCGNRHCPRHARGARRAHWGFVTIDEMDMFLLQEFEFAPTKKIAKMRARNKREKETANV